LKNPKDFTLIGAPRLPRLDSKAKSNGTAVYAIDIMLPDMVAAVVASPPRPGAQLRAFDSTAAKSMPGVIDVVRVADDSLSGSPSAAINL
jgi:isoquinoline 1-oxidoreductase beta subunit